MKILNSLYVSTPYTYNGWVSPGVQRLAFLRLGTSGISAVLEALQVSPTKSVSGGNYQELFFQVLDGVKTASATLNETDKAIFLKQVGGRSKTSLAVTAFHQIWSFSSPDLFLLPLCTEGSWIVPEKSNEPTIDAVQVVKVKAKSIQLRVIQITTGSEHSVLVQPLRDIFRKFQALDYEIDWEFAVITNRPAGVTLKVDTGRWLDVDQVRDGSVVRQYTFM